MRHRVPRGVREARAVVYGVLALGWLGSGCKGCGCVSALSKVFRAEPAEHVLTDVEMVSDGSPPRVELRVDRQSGFRYRIVLETTGASALEGLPMLPGPTVSLTLDHEVTRGIAEPLVVRGDGGVTKMIEERAVLSSIGVRHAATPPEIVARWNTMLAPFVGTSILQRVTESGAIAQMRTELLGGMEPPPEVARALDAAFEAQRHFPFRLPPVPVGVGARWRFREPISVNGVHGTQTAEMVLESVDASAVAIGITVTQDAPRQDVPHPFVPGKTAVLEEFHGDGHGETTLDRVTAVPRSSRLTGAVRFTLSGETHGQRGSVTVTGTSSVMTFGAPLDEKDAAGSTAVSAPATAGSD